MLEGIAIAILLGVIVGTAALVRWQVREHGRPDASWLDAFALVGVAKLISRATRYGARQIFADDATISGVTGVVWAGVMAAGLIWWGKLSPARAVGVTGVFLLVSLIGAFVAVWISPEAFASGKK